MDKLTKEAQAHGKIFETVAFYRKALAKIPYAKTHNTVIEIEQFFADYIPPHFKFEEEEIFPTILEKGTDEEKKLVKDLQQDHDLVLKKLNQFKEVSSKCNSESDKGQIDEAINLSKDIMQLIMDHAQKEDMALFPLLKKYI